LPDSSRETLDFGVEFVQSRKAEDVLVLDLREIADFTDYFLVCTGNSDVHVRAVADAVIEGMKEKGQRPWHVEGYDTRKWILIDYVDVVVHVFQPDARRFYGLERLWGDAPAEHIEDDATLVQSG